VLAHLITEPQLATAGPLDATLAAEFDDEPLAAALAYEAALGWEDGAWVPARRRPSAAGAMRLA
jgi:hypothetical protein